MSDLRHISKKYKQGVFICDVLRGWAEVNYKTTTTLTSTNEVKSQCLWFNSHIRVQGEPIFNDKIVSKSIIFVKDLMKNEKYFYTHREICRYYDCDITIMQSNSIVSAIPWKK